jgi:hypothetical protein
VLLWWMDQGAVLRGSAPTVIPLKSIMESLSDRLCSLSLCERCCSCRRGGGTLPWITDKLFRSLFLVAWSSIFILPVLRHILPISLLVACFAVYLPSYLDGSEQNVARKSLQVQRHWAWEWIKQRYNLKIHVEEKLDPGKTYVLGVHPHSILPWGSCVNLVTPVNDEASGGFHTDFAFPKLHWVCSHVYATQRAISSGTLTRSLTGRR